MKVGESQPIHGRAVTAVVEVLDRERLMTLACNRPDGWPQATTVGYLNEGLNLYFIVARTSQKFANLQADPRASVAIRCESGATGAGVGISMAGRVSEVTDPQTVERLNRLVIERYPQVHVYCPSGSSVAVLRFRPAIVSAVGVIHGRSDAETFTVGEAGPDSVSHLF
ncbi:MAG: pyridoxamine 5'-phosphate oxidase family protein [Caulobacterales bacterium]|nr:pyridoxamine 5'-phosphate oxidase family protein [Caulobacterales bacterium]